jgi:LCP family protein required for cell wall assembly
MAYADRHPETFPQGATRALEDAVGELLGIRVHYYAQVDFYGFVKLVDAVGGVDVNVKRAWYDPTYIAIGIKPKGGVGWGVEVGRQHFNGWEALAYSRARKALGETDFTRAARQQEVVIAIRDKVMSTGSLLTNLPSFLVALGGLVTTDLPTSRLPDLAAVADDMAPGAVYRMVLNHPLVGPFSDKVLGSVQIPDLEAIRKAVADIMPAPGGTPIVWDPKATPKPSVAPAATPAAQSPG